MVAENLFGTEVPALNNLTDSATYCLATNFTPAVSGTITACRYYFPDAAGTGYTGGIYRVSDQVALHAAPASFPVTTSGWQTSSAFASPLAVTGGVTYQVSIFIPDRYVATTTYPWPKVSGNLTAGTSNGWLAVTPVVNVFASILSGNTASYFADVVFEADVSDTTVSPGGIAIPVGLGAPSISQAQDVTPGGIAIPVALGAPDISQLMDVTPSGLTIPVALGAPSISQTITPSFTMRPGGLAVPVALGAPSISQTPIVATGGGWRQLQGILSTARAEQARADSLPPVACPHDGEPLKVNVDGIVFCPYDGWSPGAVR